MRNTAVFLTFVAFSSVARAEVNVQPEMSTPEKHKVFGGILVGLSAVSAVTATGLGTATMLEGLGCALNDTGGCQDNTNTRLAQQGNAAIGLAVVSAVTAAIGIPLLVAGTNAAKLRLSAAPIVTQGGGATAALRMTF